MARLTYSFVLYLLTPLIWLRLLWRARRQPEYLQRLGERYGFYGRRPPGPLLWCTPCRSARRALPSRWSRRCSGRWPGAPHPADRDDADRPAAAREVYGDRVVQAYLPYDYRARWTVSCGIFPRSSAC
jgi:3-deoxy-D-manno-octulosonic-acid transferase